MKVDIESLAPLSGQSFVEIESLFGNINTDGLVLPDIIRSKAVSVGRVVKSSMSIRDKRLIGIDSLAGRRILMGNRTGTWLDEESRLMVIHNTYPTNPKKTRFDTPILAVLPEDFKVAPTHDESERCRYCGPSNPEISQLSPYLVAGPGGVEYCPRCNRTATGEKIDPHGSVLI